jgi:excinuclease UvrABC nuclease subunit
MKRVDWKVADFHPVHRYRVPERPGIYAIVKAERSLGMPLQTTPIYVGMATNLRRRLCTTP